MSKKSPYSTAIMCVVCSRIVTNRTEIHHEICASCHRLGWRSPKEMTS